MPDFRFGGGGGGGGGGKTLFVDEKEDDTGIALPVASAALRNASMGFTPRGKGTAIARNAEARSAVVPEDMGGGRK